MIRAVCLGLAGLVSVASVHPQDPGEEVARRQLESGRAFARQGNYAEALRDFRAVAETHATTTVADDAWLELARHYLDVAGDPVQSQAAVDAILSNYATSDSAPAAYLLAGRLALARGRRQEDLDAALANFDRVSRLFPASDTVPRALQLAGQTLFWAGRLSDALGYLGRVTAEYARHPAAAEASLTAGRILVALGDPVVAMEELQLIRNRWPEAPASVAALADLTQLHRLYIRTATGPAYAAADESPGPARLENVVGMAHASDGRIIWADETGLGVAVPPGSEAPVSVGRPRGLIVDARGRPAVIEGNVLRPLTGEPMLFAVPQSNGSFNDLERIVAAGQLSGGDWVIMDDDERSLHRFAPDGSYVAAFQPSRVTRVAVSFNDRVAGIARNGDDILIHNAEGLLTDQIPLRTTDWDLRDARDLAFDGFGHLYVLGRDAFAVFSPYGPVDAGQSTYRLLTLFSLDRELPGGFDRATAFAVDASGGVFLYDDRARRILVYR